MTIVYYNGRFIPEEEAFIPIHDRGFLFGDGLFTTIKVVEGHVYCLKAHLMRLISQSQQIQLELPDINSSLIHALIQHNAADKGSWRLKMMVTSAHASSLNLSSRTYGSFLMTIRPYEHPVDEVR